MRPFLRAAGIVFLAAATSTCSDAASPPTSSAVTPAVSQHVVLVPQLSLDAARAFAALRSAGVFVTEAHVQLTATGGAPRDTIVPVSVLPDSLRFDISVPAKDNGQQFTVLAELRAADHAVLFSGSQTVMARVTSQVSPADVVTLAYSGPGKSAAAITINPPDTTVAADALTRAYSASALDASGKAVPDLLVQWASSDSSVVTITSTGGGTASATVVGKRGTATLTATTPLGITAGVKLGVIPLPTHLVVISGGAQTAASGTTLAQPMIVEVRASDELPVPRATVTFRAATPGGSVAVTSSAADASGRASTMMTLGTLGGNYRYEASLDALSTVAVTETALVRAPAAVAMFATAGDGQSATINTPVPIPPAVLVNDAGGFPVAGTMVTFTANDPGAVVSDGAISGPSVIIPTNVSGIAQAKSWLLGPVPGTKSLSAVAAGLVGSPVTFTANATAGAGARMYWHVYPPPAATSGLPFLNAPSVELTDANGSIVRQAGIIVTIATGSGTLANATSTTDINGLATFNGLTITGAPGAYVLSVSSPGYAPLAATVAVSSLAGSLVTVAGDNQTATVATAVAIAPAVVVKDLNGNRLAGTVVQFLASGNAKVSNSVVTSYAVNVTTDAQGVARLTSWTLGTISGAQQIMAIGIQLTGGPFVVFDAKGAPGPGIKLTPFRPASASAATGIALAVQPVLAVVDSYGNPSSPANVPITASIASGGTGTLSNATALTDAHGYAIFNGLTITGAPGIYTLAFSTPGVPSWTSGAITLSATPALLLHVSAGAGQIANAGSRLRVPPAVRVDDASGTGVANTVVTFNTTTGVIAHQGQSSSTFAIATDANGIAAVDWWILGNAPGTNTLSATVAGAGGSPTTISALGVAVNNYLSMKSPPTSPATSGVPFPRQPAVQVVDDLGAPVKQAGVTVTAYLSGNTGTLTGTTAVTDANGVATFTNLVLTGPAGAYTLEFSALGIFPLFYGVAI